MGTKMDLNYTNLLVVLKNQFSSNLRLLFLISRQTPTVAFCVISYSEAQEFYQSIYVTAYYAQFQNVILILIFLYSRQLKLPIMHQWSADEVSDRWMISIDVFSRLFLAEGPGGERDSFLGARAGTAGRIARYCVEGRVDVKPLLFQF